MDVLAEILPPSYTARAEPSARDSRRQQPQGKPQDKALKSKSSALKVTKPLQESERRAGEDRRRQRMKRGRWLESRERNDRRANKLKVFVKV